MTDLAGRAAPDITAVLTAHAEGVLVGPSLASFERAIAAARQAGLAVESLVVLDRPDAATRRQFAEPASPHRVVVSDAGDPGLARNRAVAEAAGRFVTFLDGDDLWGPNWLVAAHRFCATDASAGEPGHAPGHAPGPVPPGPVPPGPVPPGSIVAHSEANIIFGRARQMWWHVDSRDPEFDPDFLRVGNYWDAMSFADRRLFERFPFVANELEHGFGHEDWHWNCVTLAAGIDHRPVPSTFHFKRRRASSQMALCDAVDAVPWATPLAGYGWRRAAPVSEPIS